MAAARRAHRVRARAAALCVMAAGARLLAVSDAMGTNDLGFARTGPSVLAPGPSAVTPTAHMARAGTHVPCSLRCMTRCGGG